MSSNLVASPAVSRYIPATTTTFSTSTYSCPLASVYSSPDSFSTYAMGTTGTTVLPPVPSQTVNSQTADSTAAQTNSKIQGIRQLDPNTVFTNPNFSLLGFGSLLAGLVFGLFHGGKTTAHA